LEQNGQKTAEFGQMPTAMSNPAAVRKGESGGGDSKDPSVAAKNGKSELIEGVDFFPIHNYHELKELYAKYYFTETRRRVANRMNDKFFSSDLNQSLQMRAYNYRWVPGQLGYFSQIYPYTSINYNPCYSGCNNNAWANLYAWWDGSGGRGNMIPTTSTGETTPILRNTIARQNATDPVQMYSRGASGTYCGGVTGWTYWSTAWKSAAYVGTRGYGYTFYYQWNNVPGENVNLANILTDGIANNYKPVHVGANSHFYVAYGWSQWDTNTDWTWAYCYPGFSESNKDDVWISWHDLLSSVKMFVH
jgi:hypothetical protein